MRAPYSIVPSTCSETLGRFAMGPSAIKQAPTLGWEPRQATKGC